MATTPRIFGQIKPGPSPQENEVLYQVPLNTKAQITLFVCNQSENSADQFRIQLIRPAPFPNDASTFIAYNTLLINNGVFAFSSIGINEGDTVAVGSVGGHCSFTLTGIEFTN